jgi:AAA ATPase domain
LHAGGLCPLLQESCLVHDQHSIGLAQLLGHPAAQVVAYRVRIPPGVVEQPLHPVRATVTGRLSKGPAVLVRQRRQQADQVAAGLPPRLDPPEPGREPAQQIVQTRCPVGDPIHRHKIGSLYRTINNSLGALDTTRCQPPHAIDHRRHHLRRDAPPHVGFDQAKLRDSTSATGVLDAQQQRSDSTVAYQLSNAAAAAMGVAVGAGLGLGRSFERGRQLSATRRTCPPYARQHHTRAVTTPPPLQQRVRDVDDPLASITQNRDMYLRDLTEKLLVEGGEFNVEQEEIADVTADLLARQATIWREVAKVEQAARVAMARAAFARAKSVVAPLLGIAIVLVLVVALIVADATNWPIRFLQLGGGWSLVGFAAITGCVALVAMAGDRLTERRTQNARAAEVTEGYTNRIQAEAERLLRFVLNERAGEGAAHGAVLTTERAPTLVELENYPDITPSTTYRRLAQFIVEHRTSAIGLAGPRGAGKTTAMWMLRDDAEVQCVHVPVSTPVYYEAADFLRLIQLRLVEELLDKENIDADGYPRLLRSSPLSLARAALKGTIWPVILLGAFVLFMLDNIGLFEPSTRVSMITLVSAVGAAIAVVGMIQVLWRSVTRRGRRLRHGSRTARLAYDRLMELRWQAAIKRGAKATGKAASFGGEASSEITHTERERSHAENVAEFRRFVRRVVEQTAQRVVICIDELDKIADAQQAINLVNAIKDLFHVEGVHFVVSISTDAMHSFATRGIPVRDVFDSSLDTVIPVSRLSYDESRQLLNGRVLYFPDAAASFCHAWSGGHARDLIRAARAMVETRRASLDSTANRHPAGRTNPATAGGSVPIVDLVASIVRADAVEKLEAAYDMLPPATGGPTRRAFIELMGQARRDTCDLPTAIVEHVAAVAAAASAPDAPALIMALPSYLRFAGDIWAVFTVPRSPRQWLDAGRIMDVAEKLATVRWTLSLRPSEAAALLDNQDLRTLVEASSQSVPAVTAIRSA